MHPIKKYLRLGGARWPGYWPVVWSVRDHGGGVAITFDDGPSEVTPQVLEVLARYRARATFFVLGAEVVRHPQMVRRILDDGHEIGIHGYEHTLRDFSAQIRDCRRALAGYGVRPRMVRTPGGRLRAGLTIRLWLGGFTTVLYCLDTHDSMRFENKWDGPAPDYDAVRGGDIVLMHDDNPVCVRELPMLLEGLAAKELYPVTVGALIGRNG